jgi:hypothetical protein
MANSWPKMSCGLASPCAPAHTLASSAAAASEGGWPPYSMSTSRTPCGGQRQDGGASKGRRRWQSVHATALRIHALYPLRQPPARAPVSVGLAPHVTTPHQAPPSQPASQPASPPGPAAAAGLACCSAPPAWPAARPPSASAAPAPRSLRQGRRPGPGTRQASPLPRRGCPTEGRPPQSRPCCRQPPCRRAAAR